MKLYICEKCKTPIKLHFIKGNVHIECPKCNQKYQLDTKSIKKDMLIPLLTVAFAVYTSITFLPDKTIDVKFIYILSVSFILAALLEWCCVKLGFLHYEKSEKK